MNLVRAFKYMAQKRWRERLANEEQRLFTVITILYRYSQMSVVLRMYNYHTPSLNSTFNIAVNQSKVILSKYIKVHGYL